MGDNESAGFEFFSNFDSGNLSKIEYVPQNESAVVPVHTARGVVVEVPDVEFNIWTKPDCEGTEFQNGNRTWFYFGIRANSAGFLVKINMVDINRQAKMFSQGMAPVYRIMPGKPNWERVRDKPTHAIIDDIFILSFKYKTPENVQSITYFAFTYPYTYTDLTCTLGDIDRRLLRMESLNQDDIYYTREAVCFTLDGRRVELLTISSHHNIGNQREARLKNLFPEEQVDRPFKFNGKKIIFVSARVHPGETPSSFVFNGLLELLLTRENPIAVILRRLYVFKLIPMLNPDGVANGYYRTDTRGVNLNRLYLNPSFELHPSIYAARALVRYYHFGIEKEEDPIENVIDLGNDDDDGSSVDDNPHDLSQKVSNLSLGNKKNKTEVWCCKCKTNINDLEDRMPGISNIIPTFNHRNPFSVGKSMCHNCAVDVNKNSTKTGNEDKGEHGDSSNTESGLFLYMDMHGHASKKGIFMYGNHFEDLERNVECMLLPKIMSLNNHNFHFTACNFTERNMYMKDRRDGMSKEGCGRVAVLKLTGLIRSYTLECNYNTGRLVNVLPSAVKQPNARSNQNHVPPKYTPQTYEEVGKALGSSILDLTGNNPFTRLPNSQFHTLSGLREWLQIHCMNELGESGYTAAKYKLRNTNKRSQAKNARGILIKARSALTKGPKQKIATKTYLRSTSVPIDRKENVYGAGDLPTKPACSKPKSVIKSRPKSYHNVGTKLKQEVTLKAKGNTTNEKSKSTAILRGALSAFPSNKPKLKVDLSSKLKGIKEQSKGKSPVSNEDEASSIKLQEICYVKDGEGKRMIAKYKKGDGLDEDQEEDLIVAWDMQNNTRVFADKQGDAGSSKMGYRVHNYGKTSSTKFKRNKRLTRRFSGVANVLGNPERLKKQIFVKNKVA